MRTHFVWTLHFDPAELLVEHYHGGGEEKEFMPPFCDNLWNTVGWCLLHQ